MNPGTNFHNHRGTVRILIADADDGTRLLYRNALSQQRCDVIDAEDGREALVKALSVRPTLVVTDTRLPILDGYALCDVLRRDSMTARVPILVVTAETRDTELDRARQAGADVGLIKPVTPAALLFEIHRLLERPVTPSTPTSTREAPSRGPLRATAARAHLRGETMTPPLAPPALTCPWCDRLLRYERSHLGGVNVRRAEQWDTYSCPSCGPFEYRQLTRRLRHVG